MITDSLVTIFFSPEFKQELPRLLSLTLCFCKKFSGLFPFLILNFSGKK
jgi:hypothetical protein